MFKFMFLCPHQIMRKMNELYVKIYPTKVAILVLLNVRLESSQKSSQTLFLT